MSRLKRISEAVAKLSQYTDHIVRLQDSATMSGSSADYKSDIGTCAGIGLLHSGQVAVQKAYMTPGSKLKPHQDKEIEIIILYEGDLSITTPDHVHYLVIGRPLTIEPNTPHIAETVGGAKLIAVTIPPSPGYPKPTA